MSESRNVTTPVGKSSDTWAWSRSTNSIGEEGRRLASIDNPRRSDRSIAAAFGTPSQSGGPAEGGAPESNATAVAARLYTSLAGVS
jgi:hypothetical protein